MATIRVQHSFQGSSGNAEDQFVNTFYFTGTRPLAGDLLALTNHVQSFYSAVAAGGGSSIASFMGKLTDAPGARVKIYDMSDLPPRQPLQDLIYEPTGHGTGTGPNLPNELAACLSYSAAPATGIPMARRRGRIYLGPFGLEALEGAGTSDNHVSTQLRTAATKAALDLAAQCAVDGYIWAVHSTAGAFAAPIARVWMDDAWDIQRRRGTRPTARTTELIS